MVARFRHVLQTKLHDDVTSDPGNLHDVVTLASLVEKETPDPAERPVVAGVFTRRLEKHMLLQCDPTVIYAARLAGRPIGVIHASDLEIRFALQYLSSMAACPLGRSPTREKARCAPPSTRRVATPLFRK